jgi:hypothetical protein
VLSDLAFGYVAEKVEHANIFSGKTGSFATMMDIISIAAIIASVEEYYCRGVAGGRAVNAIARAKLGASTQSRGDTANCVSRPSARSTFVV